jgi:hypothetical protein
MAGEHRDTEWRQGAVFSLQGECGSIGIVISHDCDICADEDVEPCIEWIPLSVDKEMQGSLTLGKNPRLLQTILYADDSSLRTANLDAREKRLVSKAEFMRSAKLFDWQLSLSGLSVFRRWLSARYSRSAFPNKFEELMRRIQEKIDKLSDKRGKGVRGLYFDLDDNALIERDLEDGPYELGVYVVYPPETAIEEANNFAKDLRTLFEAEFLHDLEWHDIHLLFCNALCEDVFPLSIALNTKTWRVDHRSLAGIPSQQYAPEPDR